ncbi:hypothetical protein TELCIR_03904 [Teladorsagia circumcincta]|uniref:ATPase family protein n=1 Tax=Teladorsagia circumcincta TaxID=45464 RepID=A0A2G9UVB7_TELCI|nr:hypothetical protein TELCIR_03904 [Teladorsagia circumcincta]
MAFLTNLDAVAKEKMRVKIAQTFRVATNIPVHPPNGKAENYVLVEGYWIERGAELPREDANYVVTKTVKQNLAEIARITSSGRYMGSYVGDSNGRLVFREGALVKAVRNGSWVILDELNLAPTDIIEALNRVCVRCGVHPSAASKMINVLSKLRVKRSITGVFSAKDGLMTLRDVFRWAKRLATDSTCDDWLQVLTNHGYFLLAGRCRNQKDVASVVETLEAELKRKIDPSKLFAMDSPYMPRYIDAKGIVMTLGMRRMLVMTEQDRTLLLSDAGVEVHPVSAREGFQIIATMNPGGDYGKKELSKALRNRFTEVWSSCDYEGSELLEIFDSRLSTEIPKHLVFSEITPAELVINWIADFFKKYMHMFRHSPSVRDVVACAEIYSACVTNGLSQYAAIYEAVSAVFLDALNGQQMRVAVDVNVIRNDAELLMNLASQAVLEGLNACFDHRRVLYIAELNRSFEIPPQSNCRFFACQNPRAQGGNRRALPKSFINRFTSIYVDDLKDEDVSQILREMLTAGRIDGERLNAMVSVNSRLASDQTLMGGPFSFNLRDLLRWVQLFEKNNDMAACFQLLYMSRMRREEDRDKLRLLYSEHFGEPCVDSPVVLSADETNFQIGQVVDDSALIDAKTTLCDLLKNLVDTDTLQKLNAASDVTELETLAEMVLIDLKESHSGVVDECREVLVYAARSAMRFEWIDSPFVRAYLDGHWLLVEDVNLCSAAVLDRLNSCLESDGRLVVSERQSSFEPLKPHPNFRAFLSMDARNGEISRAMRNRSVEIFVTTQQQWNLNPPDAAAVVYSHGKTIPSKISQALTLLSAEKQLHFSALLSEISLDEACRIIGLQCLETADVDSRDRPMAPFVKEINTDGFVVVTVCEWFSCFVKSATVYPESAEHLSRSLSKFQMTRLDVSFKNLQLIAKVVDAVIETMKEASQVGDEHEVYMFCLHLALFVVASRRSLDARTGCAPLYLAWNEICRLLTRLCSIICHSAPEDDSGDVCHFKAPNEDSEESVPAAHFESPVSKTLDLISFMRQLQSSLSSGSIQSCGAFGSLVLLESIHWRNERCRKFAQGIALMNTEYSDAKKVSSLRFTDPFSTVFLSFWEDIDFDPQLSSLSVSHLMHCELTNLMRQLWRLAPNSQILSQLIMQPPECDSRSLHPVIATLWKTRSELTKLLKKSQEKPIVFRQKASQIKASAEGLESSELLSWCCRDASPMPLHLKAAVVRRRLSCTNDPICNLEWIRHQWQKWSLSVRTCRGTSVEYCTCRYEKNVAKATEKDFVYRNKTEEEKDELEVMEFFSEREQEREVLSEEILESLLETNQPKAASTKPTDTLCAKDSSYVLALLWLRHVLAGVRHFDCDLHSSIIDSDLSLLEDLVAKVVTDFDTVLDVYRSASLAQFRRAAEILDPIVKRTQVIMERWPEVFFPHCV